MKTFLLVRFALPLSLLTAAARAELAATFEGGGAKDTRADRLPALLVNAGEAATPFLPPGEFGVTWTGKLNLPERMRLEFSFEGEGKAAVSVDGKELLAEEGKLGAKASPSGRLNKGEHDITITYKSKPDGSGRFRLFWKEAAFPKQSVPPTVFKAEVAADPARQGRLLFAENHCAKCHISETGISGMMELTEIAPILAATGDRLNEQWLARWVADPSALRPDTRMPTLVDASTAEGKQQAADIAAFLMTQKLGMPAAAAPDKALAEKGGEHFHRLGCAACHTTPNNIDPGTAKGRVPLHNVADKFQPGPLVDFLKKPDMWYGHIGMPNFALSDAEANSLAAFLLQESGKIEHKRAAFPKGNAEKGGLLVDKLNCGACHAGTRAVTPPTRLEDVFTKDWAAAGCVSGKPGGKVPKLALTEEDRAALIAFSKKGSAPLTRHIPAEYTTAKLTTLRCTSCHGIDGKPSLLDTVHVETKEFVAHVHGENEKLDQSRPHFTYLGEMLHSAYIEKMIDGTASPRPRPWLDMRMPAFAAYAGPLANGFAAIHGIAPGAAAPFEQDKALADIGKKLASKEEGFGCTTCHGVGPVKPSAAFEVEGINFALSHERLRYEWYLRWLDNPLSVTPATKMPRYSTEGKSQRPELDGDALKQFDALWHYLQKPD